MGDGSSTKSAAGGSVASGGAVGTAGAMSGGGTTGLLPPEKALGALSSDETAQLRHETDSQIDAQLEEVPLAVKCHYRGVLQGSYIAGAGASGTSDDVKQSCAASEARCIAQIEPLYIDSTRLHPSIIETVDTFSNCSASVGDYRTCTADLTRAETDVMGALPACDALDVKSYPKGLGTVPVDLVEPASCTALYAQCPKLHR